MFRIIKKQQNKNIVIKVSLTPGDNNHMFSLRQHAGHVAKHAPFTVNPFANKPSRVFSPVYMHCL